MPKTPEALVAMPPAVAAALRRLGENLAVARVRRKESQRVWARRLGVSVPTLIRLEHGDPGVGAGIYATALWLIGRAQALAELADPGNDRGALELDVRQATQRRAVRAAASVEARLGRGPGARAPTAPAAAPGAARPPVTQVAVNKTAPTPTSTRKKRHASK